MGKEDGGLTLEGLAEQMEAQTQRLEALERENAELRGKVTAPEGAATREERPAARRAPERPDKEGAARPLSVSGVAVSRRAMLTKAGAAAAVAATAGLLLAPREA